MSEVDAQLRREARAHIGGAHRDEDEITFFDALLRHFLIGNRDDKPPVRFSKPLRPLNAAPCSLLHRYHRPPAFYYAYVPYALYNTYIYPSNAIEYGY